MKIKHKIHFYLILLIVANSISGFSQTVLVDSIKCEPLIDSVSLVEYFYVVDSMPEYPGGKNEMLRFFMNHFNYPPEIDACCNIYVEFIIDTKGKMTNIKILRGLHEDFDNETLRVLKMMPDWIPDKCHGAPVNVKYVFPLRIQLH